MAKWSTDKLDAAMKPMDPDALVKAALEEAERLIRPRKRVQLPMEKGTALRMMEVGADRIRALASDPAAVAQIIEEAKKERG